MDWWEWVILAVAIPVLLYFRLRPAKASIDPRLYEVMRQADKLRKTDPEGADRLIDTHFANEDERDRALRQQLESRMRTDPDAARRLRDLLMEDLATHARARKYLSQQRDTLPNAVAILADIDQAERATQKQLAAVTQVLPAKT